MLGAVEDVDVFAKNLGKSLGSRLFNIVENAASQLWGQGVSKAKTSIKNIKGE